VFVTDLFRSIGKLFRSRTRHPHGTAESSDENGFSDQEDSDDDSNPFPDLVVVPFSDVLDLHSIPPSMVKEVVEDYLAEAHRRRLKWVRIIHGKGIGVQREAVRSILARTKFVAKFGNAPPEAGGWGATVVTLSQKKK